MSVVYDMFRLFTNERSVLSAAATGGEQHLNGIFEEFKQMQSRSDVNMSALEIGLMQRWSLVKLVPRLKQSRALAPAVCVISGFTLMGIWPIVLRTRHRPAG